MTYLAGDFWRICGRCGAKTRSSMTYKTWDGLWVCRDDFETRHPQDFVRGRRDNQTVPDPRPEQTNAFIGPLMTALAVAATPSSTTLTLDSSVRFNPGDKIGIICDDGSTVARTVNAVPTNTTITLTVALGANAAIGNIVIDYSAVAVADIG